MVKRIRAVFLGSLALFLYHASAVANESAPTLSTAVTDAQKYLEQLVSEDGIGPREAGTEPEKAAADYVGRIFSELGYDIKRQPFDVKTRDGKKLGTSQNIIAHRTGKSGKYIVLGAHYDSTNAKGGSYGAIDNGASVAVLLAIAKYVAAVPSFKDGIIMVAFGAEEVGLQGSRHYVNSLTKAESDSYLGMINMDTIVGGDKLYIHSAHSEPYQCKGLPNNYRYDIQLRESLIQISNKVLGKEGFKLHPDYSGYPSGETGNWSDHAPFACAGLPIAYIEATNFSINGKDGNDGYSQSIHPTLWDCLDSDKVTACDREAEKQWGQIWHTQADRLELMNRLFPNRINQQMRKSLQLLIAFLVDENH